MRLIDADAVDISDDSVVEFAARAIIDAQPTVEAEPVIRCRDCKHWKPDLLDESTCVCYFWGWNEYEGADTAPDDYCSFAERRDTP